MSNILKKKKSVPKTDGPFSESEKSRNSVSSVEKFLQSA